MLLSIGITLFITAIFLIIVGIVRSLWTSVFGNILYLISGLVLLFFSIFLIYQGGHTGFDGIIFGLILLVGGGLLLGIGIWISFWAPLSHRNFSNGTKLIAYGLLIIIVSVFFFTVLGTEFKIGSFNASNNFQSVWVSMSELYVGAVPFNLFAMAVFLFTNIYSLMQGFGLSKIIQKNILALMLLVVTYLIFSFLSLN